MKKNRQRGEVVVEASIVVTIVAMFMAVLFYIGMLMYQQTALTVAANETASSVAQLMANNQRDLFTGYVDSDGVYQEISITGQKSEEYLQIIQKKANVFAKYSMKSTDILSTGSPEVEIRLVSKPGELLKKQIVVTITDQFTVPLVGFFGVDNTVKFNATGRADCVDYLEYLSSVDMIEVPPSPTPDGSSIDPFIDEKCILTFVDHKENNRIIARFPILKGYSFLGYNSLSGSQKNVGNIQWPSDPIINNITFKSWVDASGKPFTKSTVVTQDMTVYGRWECTVTFNPNGGKGSVITKKVEWGKTVAFPGYTRDGYYISGWYENPEGTGAQYQSNKTPIKTSLTLYPKWQCIHVYNAQQLRPGTCVVKAWMKYTCSRCGHSFEGEGAYGGHSMGGWREVTPPANCVTPAREMCQCVYCGYQLFRNGRLGGHVMGGWYCIRGATCSSGELWERRCIFCGYLEHQDRGGRTDHVWGRCGKTHDLGGDAYRMDQHSQGGYSVSTKAECMVCVHCHAPYAWWVTRNGETVSRGMYCRGHIRNGRYQSDNGYSERTNTHLHG